jgi:cytochrome P450
MTAVDITWDPFDTEIDTDPYPTWRAMRDHAPLYRNEKFDFWALTRFDDVEAAHKDTVTFSSAHGTVLEIMSTNVMAGASSIIFMDPPEHTQLRSLVSRAFTPRRVSQLEGRIRELCAELFAPVEDQAEFDYVQDFAARLPAEVIASLLGVPEADREFAREKIDTVFYIEPDVGMINETSLNAQIELFQYLGAQLEECRAHPRDDMLTALVEAEITADDGTSRKLTDHEATSFANLLISAGTETVARLLGNAAVVLAAHPDQRTELAGDASLLPNAVEELLRFEAPSPVQGRWVTRDVELHGTTVPADSKILLITGAAVRDERKFADPDRFDVHRPIDHHVSFGYGVHFCLGAALARLEGRVGIEETLKRFPEWDVDTVRGKRQHTSTVRGWSEVPFIPTKERS